MSTNRFAAGLLLIACSASLSAQDSVFSLPTNAAQWLNSPPVSLEAMQGKGAVLYFFEES